MPRTRPKRVRMQTVADRVGVSLSTVSMALSNHPNVADETRSRILKACSELDYTAPRNRQSRPNELKRLGLLLLGESLEAELAMVEVNWVVRAAEERAISVQVAALESVSDQANVKQVMRRQAREVDAMMLTGLVRTANLRELDREDCSIILYGNVLRDDPAGDAARLPCHQLFHDDIASARFATDWLLARGHRVGFVAETMPPGLTHDCNHAGYLLAHHKRQCALDPRLVQIGDRAMIGGTAAAAAFSAMDDPPDAYLIPEARTAFSFMTAMRERGHALARDRVVISCDESQRRMYMLEKHPCYSPDIAATADSLFGLLANRGAWSTPQAIRLPHTFHNFD